MTGVRGQSDRCTQSATFELLGQDRNSTRCGISVGARAGNRIDDRGDLHKQSVIVTFRDGSWEARMMSPVLRWTTFVMFVAVLLTAAYLVVDEQF